MLFKTICVNWHTPFTHDLISGDFSGLIPNSPTIRTLKNYSIVCSMFFGVVFILYCLCLRLLIFPYSCGLELFGSKYSHYPFIYLYPFWNHWCKCNNNGLLLLETCNAHDFLISNTVFRLFTRNKTSWMHPPSKHWHLLDYVTVWQRDRQNVWVTKTMWWSRLLDQPLSVDLEAKMNPVLHHQLQTSSYDLAALCHVLLILIRKWPTES